jgi:dihydropyrimidinase
MDLIIKGGTVVTAGSSFNADISIRDGKVAQIGGEMSGASEIDASCKRVIPASNS